MPAVLLDEEQTSAIMEDVKTEKKHKRSKEHKKRPREEDDNATPRSHKKSKKHRDEEPPAEDEDVVKQEVSENGESKKKSKKHRMSKDFTNGENIKTELDQEVPAEEPAKKSKKKHKKHLDEEPVAEDDAPQDAEQTPKKRKKDKSKKERRAEGDEDAVDETQSKPKSRKKRKEREQAAAQDGDAMDIDETQPATTTSTSNTPSNPGFPFFTQTISLYVPFFPIGFDKPITNVAAQHLDPLLNHYSPLLRGVLLAYRNVNLSEIPKRPDPKHLPDDHTPALLESLDEYAVGFGWLTADVDLFIPSRGAWMEGTVNLQSEGHVGVVCFEKFNASIEAKRLPSGWRWVDIGDSSNNSNSQSKGKHTFLTADPDTPSPAADDAGTDILDDSPLELAELHTTGYWVDSAGEKVTSAPLRFRIKNFDVGVAGDYGYISIEGTTLGDEDERELSRQEREVERRRRDKQNPGGLLRPMLRRVPDFSLTSFGREDQEEDSVKKTVIYQQSRPGTPDD